MNNINKFLYHKLIKNKKRWHPFLSVFYLTNACRFRCPFCSDGLGKPYYQLSHEVLQKDSVLDLLSIVRRYSSSLVLTGGEPLDYPEFSEVIIGLKDLKFKDLILTTNGYNLDRFLPEIIQSVTNLGISLNTLDTKKGDAIYGTMGIADKVMENIELAHEKFGLLKGKEINISSVVTPDNIEDLYEVYFFAKERNFIYAACPELQGVKANEGLEDNIEYRKFFDFLIREKKGGAPIHGSVLYLEYMRDLRNFSCVPLTLLAVTPLGDVYYPCLERGTTAGNLLEEPDLHTLLEKGRGLYGPLPICGNQCHSACALGFSVLLNNTFSLVGDSWV